jgi:hypothetical protein
LNSQAFIVTVSLLATYIQHAVYPSSLRPAAVILPLNVHQFIVIVLPHCHEFHGVITTQLFVDSNVHDSIVIDDPFHAQHAASVDVTLHQIIVISPQLTAFTAHSHVTFTLFNTASQDTSIVSSLLFVIFPSFIVTP